MSVSGQRIPHPRMRERASVAYSPVRIFGHLHKCTYEFRRLTNEQPILSEAINGGHRPAELTVELPNDRAARAILGHGVARNGETQVGLVEGPTRFATEIGERYVMVCHRRLSVWKSEWRSQYGIACEFHPGQKMRYLIASDAEDYFQHRNPPHLLAEAGVEARTGVLDKSKMKGRCVCDLLNMGWSFEIRICAGNALSIDNADCLRGEGSTFWILQAAITDVPTGVHV